LAATVSAFGCGRNDILLDEACTAVREWLRAQRHICDKVLPEVS
jgi:hypothetical protein